MNAKERISVVCIDCHSEYDVSYSHYRCFHNKPDHQWRCKSCYRLWRKNVWYNNLSEDKRNEISLKRSQLSKNIWANKNEEEKTSINDTRASTRKNRSAEDKEYTRNKTKKTWESKSEEEMQIHKEIRRNNTQKFWDNLSDDEREEILNKMSQAQHEYFNSLSEEERMERADRIRESSQQWWDSLSDEEYKSRIAEMSRQRKSEWANSPDNNKRRIENISIARKQYWNNMTPEQYKEWSKQRKHSYDEYIRNLNIVPNKNELELISNFRGLEYRYQYYSKNKHPDFDKLFPLNPVTKSKFVSPYHQWDFIIKSKLLDVLIDIDGSIHYNESYTRIHPVTQVEYSILDYQKFNDSQRPYQTDGLDAYVIQCYDDKLTDDTPVLRISDDSKTTFKEFKNYLSCIFVINSMSDKDIMKSINESL